MSERTEQPYEIDTEWKMEKYDTKDVVFEKIRKCEGKHRQQIAYSSYHDQLSQICFDCKTVRCNA